MKNGKRVTLFYLLGFNIKFMFFLKSHFSRCSTVARWILNSKNKKKPLTPKKGKKKQRKSPCSKLKIYGFMFEFTVLMPQEVLLSVVQFKQERWWSMMHKQDSWHERRSKILWLTPPFQGKTKLYNTSSVLYSKKQQWLQRLILRLRKNFEPAQ